MTRTAGLFLLMGLMLVLVGALQSWVLALTILQLCLISSIMALGVNIQWGYAGLFNVGIMGFCAIGGVAAVLVAAPPVPEAWVAGGRDLLLSIALAGFWIALAVLLVRRFSGVARLLGMTVVMVAGYATVIHFFYPARLAIEAVDPSRLGFLGGLGLPILFSWVVGAAMAAGLGLLIGRITLGLRSDYLAIATLGIAEIVLAAIKNEDWLTRGVKNVSGLPRPIPYETDLAALPLVGYWAQRFGISVNDMSIIATKLFFVILFALVLGALLLLSEKALRAPWGRMVRAARDNRAAAEAMGKDVRALHVSIFVIGSALAGLAGAMLVTLDGQFTPTSYQPLRFTFLIWVMVIVGGSGNNFGAILGGFLIWVLWVEAEPMGQLLVDFLTSGLDDGNGFRLHMLAVAPQLRLLVMGVILLLVLRFFPRGLLPER